MPRVRPVASGAGSIINARRCHEPLRFLEEERNVRAG